jgi:ABC-type Fe3+-siderophore transport system permease subunit
MHSPITFQFLIIAVYVFLIGILLKRLGSKIYLFHIGTGLTKTLGFDLVPLYRDVILIIFLGTHLVVSQFGVFSFMGLILPPLLRNLSKSKNFQFEITWGACLSGLIFAVLDLGCYFITFDGAEFPVGLFSSLIGSFVLLILSWKRFLSI